MKRPMQLALIEGHERAVGEAPMSVTYGHNADLIASVAPIYLTGSVLDVTYGRGMWWKRFRPDIFAWHDIEHDGVDFRALPEDDGSWDTVCFDPPYIPRQGRVSATRERDEDYRSRYGLTTSRGPAELEALIAGGLVECARVARRWVLVKSCDFTNGSAFHLGHVKVINHAVELGLVPHDLIVHASGTGPGGARNETVLRARRAHSYLIVFRKRGRR